MPDEGDFELTYSFAKPILVKGYILETANVEGECDPKDWTVDCRNIADNVTTVISTVVGEADRDRWVEKEYHVDEEVGDIWTDLITIRVSATQQSTGFCHFNQWTIMTDQSVLDIPEG